MVVVVDDDDDVSLSDSMVNDDLLYSTLDDQAMSIDDMYILYCRLCDIVVVAKFPEATRSEQLLEK